MLSVKTDTIRFYKSHLLYIILYIILVLLLFFEIIKFLCTFNKNYRIKYGNGSSMLCTVT